MEETKAALAHLKKADPVLYLAAKKHHHSLSVKVKRQSADKLFAILCESVVSQQLSVKASDTIWKRLEVVCGGKVTPSSILSASLPRLRKAGLSAAKAKTLKEIAKTVKKGLNLPSLRKKTPEEATEALVAIWGVGPWTAEMFLIFGLHHPDIFSARDLGLVRAMETLYGLKNPTPKTLDALALAWSPHRTFASRILWRSRDAQ